MATPADLYVNGIRKNLRNYFAAWLPSQQFKLGDVGILEGNFFTRVTSLENLGITFEKLPSAGSASINYVSESGVTINIKASGQTDQELWSSIPEGNVGIGIEFTKEGAFVVQAAKSYESSISDIVKVEEDIRRAYQNGEWKAKWAVVSHLVSSPSATILISNSSQAKIEFTAKVDVDIAGLNLGNAGAGFSMTRQTGDIWQSVNAENVTPFFKLVQLQAKPFLFDILKSLGNHKFNFFEDDTAHLNRVEPLDLVTPSLAKTNIEVAETLFLDDKISTRENPLE